MSRLFDSAFSMSVMSRGQEQGAGFVAVPSFMLYPVTDPEKVPLYPKGS